MTGEITLFVNPTAGRGRGARAARPAASASMCPDADLTDGPLDLTVVGDRGRATPLKVFPTVHRGTHVEHPKVTVLRAARVELAAEGVTGHADGEPLARCP